MWFHGSPFKIAELKSGSTITGWKDLAIAFSHKPACLIIEDNGKIKHNGILKGFLYKLDEDLSEGDIRKHPDSSMDDGLEWITRRDVRLSLIEEIKEIGEPFLSDQEIKELTERKSK